MNIDRGVARYGLAVAMALGPIAGCAPERAVVTTNDMGTFSDDRTSDDIAIRIVAFDEYDSTNDSQQGKCLEGNYLANPLNLSSK